MNTHILNYNILSSVKAEIQDLTVGIVVNGEKNSKSPRDLDLDQTMPKCRTRPRNYYIVPCVKVSS